MPYRVICSPSALRAEFEDIRQKVSLPETEESSGTIEQGIAQLTQRCNIGCCKFSTEMLAGVLSLSQQLNFAMNSERSSLSKSAVELVTALSAGLGPSFEPLISVFIPTILRLCTRRRKVFNRPAKACILTLIENIPGPLPSLLPYLAASGDHKSASPVPLLVAAEGILACLNSEPFSIPNITMDNRARLIEDVIIVATQDASADIRAAGKDIFGAYKVGFPDRVVSFIAYLTPAAKKHLGAQGMAASRPTSQVIPRHRPTTGRAEPVCNLQAKITSEKHSDRREHPLDSELPRDVYAMRPIGGSKQATSARQGTLRSPSTPVSSSVQSTNQGRDVVRPVVHAIQGPQRVGNKGTAALRSTQVLSRCRPTTVRPVGRLVEGPRAGEGTRRVLVRTTPLPETNGTEMAVRKTGLPSIKPISAGPSLSKLLVSKCHPKGNSFATKIPSACSTAATVSLPSQMVPLPVAKSEHPTTGGRGSRIPRWRSHALPSTEVKVQTSSQTCHKEALWSPSSKQALCQRKPVSGGPAVKVHKPVVEVLPISQLRGASSSCLEEGIPLTVCPTAMPLTSFPVCTPRQSRQFGPAESADPPVHASARDMLVQRDANRPSQMGRRLRRSSGRPRRQRAFLASTTRASISSPLSPFETSGIEVIAHTHAEQK